MPTSLSRDKPLDVGRYGVDGADLPPFEQGPIDLSAWFDEDRRHLPLDLEIGSGKGTFLVQEAPRTPDVNYIGLEYARAFWRYGADRLRRLEVANARMVCAEAGFFVRNYVPDGALRQVHIYFPDPWPKKRHHKRRLVQAPFLRELHAKLRPCSFADTEAGGAAEAGWVRLATDHADYFAWMEEHAAAVADLFERRPFESPGSAGDGELVGSNFERKYRQEGRSFFGMLLRRRS